MERDEYSVKLRRTVIPTLIVNGLMFGYGVYLIQEPEVMLVVAGVFSIAAHLYLMVFNIRLIRTARRGGFW